MIKKYFDTLKDMKIIIGVIVSICIGAFSFGSFLGNQKADFKIQKAESKCQEKLQTKDFDIKKLELKIIELQNENKWLAISSNKLKEYILIEKSLNDDASDDDLQKLDDADLKIQNIIKDKKK